LKIFFGPPLHHSTPHADENNNQELSARLQEARKKLQEELDNSRVEAARKEEEIKQERLNKKNKSFLRKL